MRIAVLGGAGAMAKSAVLDLVESQEVTSLVLADMNRKNLEALKTSLESKKVRVATVDITDHASLVGSIRGSHAVINGTVYYHNVEVMKACLDVKTHYVDMGGLFHVTRNQMLLDEDFRRAGLTAVLGMGSAPGMVNVMARFAYDRLDTIESVRIRDGIVNFTRMKSPLGIPYALDTILDEFLMNPYIFENGDWVELRPFSRPEDVDFPEPVGRQTTFMTLHSEIATIPVSFKDKGVQEVSFKLALPKAFEEKIRFLVDLGLGSRRAISVGGTNVIPRDVLIALSRRLPKAGGKPDDHKVLRVDVRGTQGGNEVTYRLESVQHPYEPWGVRCGSFTVGFPAAVVAKMLASGEIKTRGAMGPERCVHPEAFFGALAARGLSVTVTQTQNAW
jgi:saccharopine dehydrogenase-like NADP-dependent oxidoreductase